MTIDWFCNKCLILKTAQIFPFGLENNQELQDIMQTDSMKMLDNLPNFEITSKALRIDQFQQNDIDENIVNNIDSRYYSSYELQLLSRANYFNMFHANFNGLENKIDSLHNFINTTKLDFDIINVSETSQKFNEDFATNILINGYKQPFVTGSKYSKGGVAIYAKEELNVLERDDLNKSDDCFEAIWIEIKVEKSKNLICGCVYRHPSTDISVFESYISKCQICYC